MSGYFRTTAAYNEGMRIVNSLYPSRNYHPVNTTQSTIESVKKLAFSCLNKLDSHVPKPVTGVPLNPVTKPPSHHQTGR